MWVALGDERIKNIVALAPVTDLMVLSEFKNFNKGHSVTNFDGYYQELSRKRIFLQVSNFDGRISTSAALRFVEKVGASQPVNIPIDLTAVITPKRGHSDAEHEKATEWLLDRANGSL